MNASSTSLSPVPLRPEDAWLLAAVRSTLLGMAVHPPESRGAFDWDYLQKQASLHALGPCLARYCESLPAEIPETVKVTLKEELDRVRAYNFFLLQELTRLCDNIQSSGLNVMAWKGPALAASVYPDPGLRQCADLDLLVTQENLNSAVTLLQGIGYREQDVETGGHTRNLERNHPKAVVELHSQVAQSYFSIPLKVQSLFSRTTQIRSLCGTIPVPAAENLLLLLCIHGSKHVWERLIWICDVVLLLRAYPGLDWPAVWRDAEALGCRRMVAMALLLAHGLAENSVPASELAKCRQDPQAVRLAQKTAHWMFLSRHSYSHNLKRSFFLLSMREHAADRWPLARRFCGQVFTPGDADRAFVKLPAACNLLYYLIRPVRLIIRTIVRS